MRTALWIGLMVGSFTAEFVFGAGNWHKAIDHSYYQGMALFAHWLLEKYLK